MIESESATVAIPLGRDQFALIDATDAALVLPYKWSLWKRARKPLYAKTWKKFGRQRKMIFMHQLLVDAPSGLEVDHRDGNGLNNRRGNLRLATRQDNSVNVGPRGRNTSGYKGVSWDRERGVFRAQITWKRHVTTLGRFASPEAAAHAYDAKARELHGEFARLNFPDA